MKKFEPPGRLGRRLGLRVGIVTRLLPWREAQRRPGLLHAEVRPPRTGLAEALHDLRLPALVLLLVHHLELELHLERHQVLTDPLVVRELPSRELLDLTDGEVDGRQRPSHRPEEEVLHQTHDVSRRARA